MFIRLLSKSISKRKSRIIIAVAAVIMGVSIPAAMFTVSFNINGQIGQEFRKFGANLLIVPESDTIDVGIGDISLSSVTNQQFINETDIYKIKSINWSRNVQGYAPFLYQVITAEAKGEEQQVVLTGTWFDKNTTLDDGVIFPTGVKRINSWWWEVVGDWIQDIEIINFTETDCMIGKSVADKMDLQLGDKFTIDFQEETSLSLQVKGIITTGGTEDNHIFVPLKVAQYLTKRNNTVHTVQVSALCIACPVETIAAEIEAKISNIDAKTILQMTNTEMSVLNTIETMMTVVSFIALLATLLGVSTTMTTSVLERKTEIGLMMSIGAENMKIVSLFLAESLLVGFVGGSLGYFVGIIGAQFVSLIVFDSLVSPQIIVLPIIIGISSIVSLLASIIPIKRALNIEPVLVLRGD
ncbi:MAG: ABC transporter permease [Candidatus Hodarchaeales archaeon]|jgi:putative ABC transport system permease protein